MALPTKNSVDVGSVPLSANLGQARALLDGDKWGSATPGIGVTLTWSVPQGTAWFARGYSNSNEWNSWYSFSAIEIAGADQALKAWTDVSGVSARRVADNQSVVGEIRFARTDYVDDGSVAHAYFPSASPSAGDVWTKNSTWNVSGFAANTPGTDDYHTLLHEIGHALGLKHPFETSFNNPRTIDPRYDSYFHTVMSYNAAPWSDDDVTPSFYPTTPMYYDLVAIQYLYGRDLKSHAGNTKYQFSMGQAYWQTIDDASGYDTISYSGFQSCTIDLREGRFSIVGDAITFSDGTSSLTTVSIGPGTVIEAAIGGTGSDRLIGNGANNVLKGGGGGDRLYGGAGGDQLFGGLDDDVLTGSSGIDYFVFNTGLTSATPNVDRITDFSVKDDTIRLDDAVFTKLKRGVLPASKFTIGKQAKDSSDRIIYDKRTGDLFYDSDGTGPTEQIKFALLSKNLKMTTKDLFVI